MDRFKKIIEDFFGIEWDSIVKKGKEKKIVFARNFTYYILHEKYKISARKISIMFNRCDREIKYRIAIMRSLIKYQPRYRETYAKISVLLSDSLV